MEALYIKLENGLITEDNFIEQMLPPYFQFQTTDFIEDSLSLAVQRNNSDIINLLFSSRLLQQTHRGLGRKNKHGENILFQAVRTNNPELVGTLIENINSECSREVESFIPTGRTDWKEVVAEREFNLSMRGPKRKPSSSRVPKLKSLARQKRSGEGITRRSRYEGMLIDTSTEVSGVDRTNPVLMQLINEKNNDEETLVEFCLKFSCEKADSANMEQGYRNKYLIAKSFLQLNPDLRDSNVKQKSIVVCLLKALLEEKHVILSSDELRALLDLFLQCGSDIEHRRGPERHNLLHLCCIYNQPSLLGLILGILRGMRNKVDTVAPNAANAAANKAEELLNQTSLFGFTPLTLCCWHSFNHAKSQSRLECVQVLVNNGSDINKLVPQINYTPLILSMSPLEINKGNEDIACYLISSGALIRQLNPPNGNRLSIAFLACVHLSARVLHALIQKKELDLSKNIEDDKVLPLVIACNRYIMLRTRNESTLTHKRRLNEVIDLFMAYNSPTASTLFYFCLVERFKNDTGMFRRMLSLSMPQSEVLCAQNEINNHLTSHLSLLFMSVLYDNLGSLKVLLAHGADPTFRYRPRLCTNNSPHPHRWVQYDSLASYFEFQREENTARQCVCHICLGFIKNEKLAWACQEGETCDCRVCENCQYFTLNATQTKGGTQKKLDMVDFARRKWNPAMIKLTSALNETAVGTQFLKKHLVPYLDLFISSGMTEAILSRKLERRHLKLLGVQEKDDQNRILLALSVL